MNEPAKHEALKVDLYRRGAMEGQMCDVPEHLRHEVMRIMSHVRRYVERDSELANAVMDMAAAAAWANLAAASDWAHQTERGENKE